MKKEPTDFLSAIKNTYDAAAAKPLNYLLVMPRLVYDRHRHYDFPLGIPYISSTLKLSGRKVFTLNLNYKDADIGDLIARAIDENGIDVVATGGLSAHYWEVYNVVAGAKRHKPGIVTIVGGGIISADPETAMTALEYADFGVLGEGEITMCELARSIEKQRAGDAFAPVDGIVYHDGQGWATTPQREEIADIDTIPFPDYAGFGFEETLGKEPYGYHGAGVTETDFLSVIATGRSCPYNCTFCFHTSGKRYRRRTLENIMREVDFLAERYGITVFYIADELFASDKGFLRDFCGQMRSRKLRWTANLRVDMVSREQVALFKDSGCIGFCFGLESADDRVLKSMRKYITVSQIEQALTICHEMGMSYVGNFIFGDLAETYETATNTLDWWLRHPEFTIKLQWIMVFPGSLLYEEACRRGLITDKVRYLKDGPRDINVSQLTETERKDIAWKIDTLRQDTPSAIENVTLSRMEAGMLSIEGTCRHCGAAVVLDHKDLFIVITLEHCPSCGRGLPIYPYDYINPEAFSRNLAALLKKGKVAFWPTVAGVHHILDWSPQGRGDDVYFVDSSEAKQGRRLSGEGDDCEKYIESPAVIARHAIKTVVLTTMQAAAGQITHTVQAQYPIVDRICFINDMMFEDFALETKRAAE